MSVESDIVCVDVDKDELVAESISVVGESTVLALVYVIVSGKPA